MLAAIDIHKALFQAAVLNPDDGQITEERFAASRKAVIVWLAKWDGQITVVALEATTGWRWVARELQARGVEVRLCDPGQAKPRAHQIRAQVLPAAHQVAQVLLLFAGHPHQPQITGREQPRQPDRVARVGLDPIPRTALDVARRADHHLKALSPRARTSP